MGSGIELDAFVEAEIVQPLKYYISGKMFPIKWIMSKFNMNIIFF